MSIPTISKYQIFWSFGVWGSRLCPNIYDKYDILRFGLVNCTIDSYEDDNKVSFAYVVLLENYITQTEMIIFVFLFYFSFNASAGCLAFLWEYSFYIKAKNPNPFTSSDLLNHKGLGRPISWLVFIITMFYRNSCS